MATQNKNTYGYKDGSYSLPVLGMSLGDFITGNHYDMTTGRNRIPFVNNWTSGLFVTLKTLYANRVPDTTYEIYKQQEQEIINTAISNAEAIKAKGEIELRNLQYKHDREMGSDIIKVSGSGGNMSGSFLDALMQQRKYQMLDEKSVATNTINQASAVMKEAYRNAANVAVQAQTTAQKQKNGVFNAIMAGIDKYFELSFKDKSEAARNDALNEQLENTEANIEEDRKRRYNSNASSAVIEGLQRNFIRIKEEPLFEQDNPLKIIGNTYSLSSEIERQTDELTFKDMFSNY